MIDSHAHVASELFDADRPEVVSRARDAGVHGWIEVGTNVLESEKAVALAQKYPHVCASVGVHPDSIAGLQESDWNIIEMLARTENVCAIGEVGFDTFRNGTIAAQEIVLRQFIALAQKLGKPIIFHVRSGNGIDAHAELLRVLSSYPQPALPKGVIHTFSGTLEQAERYIDHGMMISFSGVITFTNAGALPEIAKAIPLSSILVETDCPFLTPEPFRGTRNEPAYVRHVIQKIADIRGVSFEEIERSTEENTNMLFDLDF